RHEIGGPEVAIHEAAAAETRLTTAEEFTFPPVEDARMQPGPERAAEKQAEPATVATEPHEDKEHEQKTDERPVAEAAAPSAGDEAFQDLFSPSPESADDL